MYNFTFNIPTKIHFGKDTISNLSELKAYGSKVLLVYGGGSIKKNGISPEHNPPSPLPVMQQSIHLAVS